MATCDLAIQVTDILHPIGLQASEALFKSVGLSVDALQGVFHQNPKISGVLPSKLQSVRYISNPGEPPWLVQEIDIPRDFLNTTTRAARLSSYRLVRVFRSLSGPNMKMACMHWFHYECIPGSHLLHLILGDGISRISMPVYLGQACMVCLRNPLAIVYLTKSVSLRGE